jgi:type III pantothenate kinase
MTHSNVTPVLAVDVGNSRIKFGEFAAAEHDALPRPRWTGAVDLGWSEAELTKRLTAEAADFAWTIASVNRPAANRLIEWLSQRGVERVRLLTHADMPLSIDVDHPAAVGLDRLADATAANHLRTAGRPAVVVDHGSAITVNLISAEGTFQGGAILPGVNMSARALHEFTDGLPLVEVGDAPEVLVRSTAGALHFGIAWGAVGAVREVIARLLPDDDAPQIILTGGGGAALATILGQCCTRPPQFVPHLTLAGVALAAAHGAARDRP